MEVPEIPAIPVPEEKPDITYGGIPFMKPITVAPPNEVKVPIMSVEKRARINPKSRFFE